MYRYPHNKPKHDTFVLSNWNPIVLWLIDYYNRLQNWGRKKQLLTLRIRKCMTEIEDLILKQLSATKKQLPYIINKNRSPMKYLIYHIPN